MNKRIIIGVVGVLLGIAVLGGIALAIGGIGDDRRTGAIATTSYASGKFFVEIDGVNVGAVRGVEGCAAAGSVIDEQVGADKIVHKHVGNLGYEPCVLKVGAGLDSKVYKWIKDMLARAQTRHTVVIHSVDYDLKIRASTQLLDALLTKVKFPTLDASVRDAASIELTIQAEQVKAIAGSGQTISSSIASKQKQWTPSNFRFTLSGVNDLNRVNKISSLEVTQEVTQDSVGELRDYQKEPGKLQLGNLVVSLAESHSASMDAWFDDFLIKGNSDQTKEKTGTIEFLNPTLTEVLFTLSLKGVGIFRGGEVAFDAGTEGIKRKTYSLYIEEATFVEGSPVTATTSPTPPPPPPPPPPPAENPPPPAPVATAASGTITAVAGFELQDGPTFTISDGAHEPTIFEFDADGAAELVAVSYEKGAEAATVGEAIAEAINGVGEALNVTAKFDGEAVQLQNDSPGAAGNVPIEETVENEGFVVKGMSGGTGGEEKPAPEGSKIPAPTSLAAKTGAGEGDVDLDWQPSEGAIGYVVLFSTESGGERHELTETRETSITLGGLKSGVPHHFVVRAITDAGVSGDSNEATGVPG